MTIRFENSVFVHVPRTGGVWLREAIKTLEIKKHVLIGDYDSHLTHNELPDDWGGQFKFSFIRHPLAWVRSRWTHAIEYRTPEEHTFFGIHRAFDELVKPTFVETLQNILEKRPGLYEQTLWEMQGTVCALCQTESLPNSVCQILQQHEGLTDSQLEVIRAQPRFNSTVLMNHWHDNPELQIPQTLQDEFLASEALSLQTWNSAKGLT